MPAFHRPLPTEIDSRVQQLLFTFAQWHAFAKLCQHTTSTLETLKSVTVRLGGDLRAFQGYTLHLDVLETPRELAARQRRAASKVTVLESLITISRQRCILNLNTYKFYALGDYPSTIARYGTTDSYSTQTVGNAFITCILASTDKYLRLSCSIERYKPSGCEQTTEMLLHK